VGEVVKEAFDIGIEYIGVPVPIQQLQDSLHRLVAVALWAKAEGSVVKLALEDRCEQAPNDFLPHPIPNRGYP